MRFFLNNSASANYVGLILAVIAVSFDASHTMAQDLSLTPKNEMSAAQIHVKRMVEELEAKCQSLAAKLKETEPEQAEKLLVTFEQARKMLLANQMGRVARMLDESELEKAGKEQQRILDNLRKLIVLLTTEADLDEVMEKIRELEGYKKEVEKLIEAESSQLAETLKLIDKKAYSENIDKNLETLRSLVEDQAAVVEALERFARELPNEQKNTPLEAIANQQDAVSRMTKQWLRAKEESRVQETTKALKEIAQNKAQDGQQNGQQAGQQNGQQRPNMPSGIKRPTLDEKAVQDAIQSQQEASDALDKKQIQDAIDESQNALDKLKKAETLLDNEKKRILRLPPDQMERMAKRQERTLEDLWELKRSMSESSSDPSSNGNESGDSENSDAKQNQSALEQAGQKMRQASNQFRKNNTSNSANNQADAIEDLQKVQKRLEEMLNQLREEMFEEMLAALEERFREILVRQEEITIQTADLDLSRIRKPSNINESEEIATWGRTQKLACLSLARSESDLHDLCDKAYIVLVEDGTTVVFPSIVNRLTQEFKEVSQLLSQEKTGEDVQLRQTEIELTLKDLIEALQEAREQARKNQSNQSSQAQRSRNNPLVPGSAELKLLKQSQLRVNRLTEKYQDRFDDSNTTVKSIFQLLTKRQMEVEVMTREMLERSMN